MDNPYFLSQEKHDELISEFEDLKMNRRREIAERLEYAKSLGDLSENAEYHAAREEQAETEERISQLESILKSSQIITMHHSVSIEPGSTLKVKRLSDNTEYKYTIVGTEEADFTIGKISYLSPIGAGLLGKKKGDEVLIQTPKGEVKYKIISVE